MIGSLPGHYSHYAWFFFHLFNCLVDLVDPEEWNAKALLLFSSLKDPAQEPLETKEELWGTKSSNSTGNEKPGPTHNQRESYRTDDEEGRNASLKTWNMEKKPEKGAEEKPEKKVSPEEEALIWGVLGLGAHMAGKPQEGLKLVVKARENLLPNPSQLGNHLRSRLRACFLISFYYLGIRDFRASLLFLKISLDLHNSLTAGAAEGTVSSPTFDPITCVRDLWCLFLRLPPCPSLPPLAVSREQLEIGQLLLDVQGTHSALSAAPVSPIEGARCTCLRLASEATGLLMYTERQRERGREKEGKALLGKELFLLITRDMELCLQLLRAWQWAGPMNGSMEAYCHATLAWAVYHYIEGGKSAKDGSEEKEEKGRGEEGKEDGRQPPASPLPGLVGTKETWDLLSRSVRDRQEIERIYKKEQERLDQIAPTLSHALASLLSTASFTSLPSLMSLSNSPLEDPTFPLFPSSSSSSQLASFSPQDLKSNAIQHIRTSINLALNHPWKSYFNPLVVVTFYNLTSIAVEWDLWDELYNLSNLLKSFAEIWPFIYLPHKKIEAALNLNGGICALKPEDRKVYFREAVKTLSAKNFLDGKSPDDIPPSQPDHIFPEPSSSFFEFQAGDSFQVEGFDIEGFLSDLEFTYGFNGDLSFHF